MKLLKIFFVLTFTIITIGCSSGPDVLIHKDFDGDGIAVMNFETKGSFPEPNVGETTADKLTEALFLNGNYRVIDRSTVNNYQIQLGIKSTEIISPDELKKIGYSINASYIILGKIERVSDREFMTSDTESQLYISFRIISSSDSEVIGMATYNLQYSKNVIPEIDAAIKQMVNRM